MPATSDFREKVSPSLRTSCLAIDGCPKREVTHWGHLPNSGWMVGYLEITHR